MNESKLEWISNAEGWWDWAWTPKINATGLNFVVAYRVATLVDIKNAEDDGFDTPPRSEVDKYWCAVYLTYSQPDDFYLREDYPVEKLRQHLELKCKVLGLERLAIERLHNEGLLVEEADD
jgi:hypothetical protein